VIYNFRIDRTNREEIIRRLREESHLSQGWGGGQHSNLRIDREDYVTACRDFYELASTRIATNLTWMREFKDDDLIVTPHLPENGKVSIHVINGDFPECYAFLNDDEDHLNNRFKIKRSYGLDGNIDIHNVRLARWYGKLQWLRLPVLPIQQFEADFDEIIEDLKKRPDEQIRAGGLQDYLEKLTQDALELLRKSLNSISASGAEISFEKICERLVTSAGYRVERRNVYDSAGGDIDLRCVRECSESSPFEAGQTLLFVQVKKHEGETDDWPVKQLLNMIKREPAAEGCVMSLADDFTAAAKDLADKNGILLMNGAAICRLLLKELSDAGVGDA